jgi:V-type H+-transporting ATPase proteolipid subunit
LLVCIIISGGISVPSADGKTYSQFTGWAHFTAGLCCGLSGLVAGGATGIAGDIGTKATDLRAEVNHAKANSWGGGRGANEVVDEGDAGKLYIGQVTILCFSSAIGLYGFIIALITITSSSVYPCEY